VNNHLYIVHHLTCLKMSLFSS